MLKSENLLKITDSKTGRENPYILYKRGLPRNVGEEIKIFK